MYGNPLASAHADAFQQARQADLGEAQAQVLNHSIPSDSGSLLDADLADMGGAGDDFVQPISDLAHAHATAAGAVRSARSAYPAVTAMSDWSDQVTGMGAQAGRAALRGAANGAVAALSGRHPNPFKTQHLDPPEATGRAARDAIHPY
jgi:hypothetical protein